jgi:hypothetical protein
MEFFKDIWAHHKEIVVTVLAGTFTIIAAIIKRGGYQQHHHTHKNPVKRKFLLSLFCLVLGAGLLGAEMIQFNLNPDGNIALDNPGILLAYAGCFFVATGAIWGLINLFRLLGGAGKPAPEPKKSAKARA